MNRECRKRWLWGLGAFLAALALLLFPAPGLGPARGLLRSLVRGKSGAPSRDGRPPPAAGRSEEPERPGIAAFDLWTDVFTGSLPALPFIPARRSPLRSLAGRLFRAFSGGLREKDRAWEIADVVYDEEEKKSGASVRSAWSDRLFSVYGLALRPAGIDQVLGLEYRLFDALILGHQREFRLEEGRPAEAEGESKVYLRWQKEF